jgi:hypothetical protein
MDTMKAYFTALAAEADSDGYAGFDTVSTFDNTDASETATVTTTLNVLGPTSYTAGTTASNDSTVLEMIEATANSADAAKSAIAQTMGWYVDQIAASGGTVRLVINGANIPAAAAYTLTGNDAFDAAQIASATNVADASSAGAILNAKVGAYSTGTVSLLMHANDATTQAGERYASTAALTAASTDTTNPAGDFIWSVDLYDTWTLGVGSNSVTVSIGGALGGSGTATTLAQIETSVVAAWAAKYGIAGTASASAIATLVGAADGVFNIQMLQSDSGGYDKAITFSMSDAGTAAQSSRTGGNIGWMIGATKSTGDNSTVASANDGLIITVTSKEAGSDLNTLTTVTTATDGSKATMVAFATNYTANETWSGGTGDNAYAGTQVERTDVVNVEESVAAATSNAVAQTLFNRVTWLG